MSKSNRDYSAENTCLEYRQSITKMLMKLFEHWKLDTSSQLTLIGMKESTRAILSKYRQGERALPDNADKLDKAGLLLLIHKCLHSLFPENPEIVYGWMTSSNRVFNYQLPLNSALKNGIIGLAKIARYLELELVH